LILKGIALNETNWITIFLLFPCLSFAQQYNQQLLGRLIDEVNLPGIQLAYTANNKTFLFNAGVGKHGLPQTISSKTIFRAGSLGKCVFAYAILRLCDRGVLSLDTPLMRYMGTYNRFDAADPRYSMITARMVLSHTSGLAEFQEFNTGEPVRLLFTPGSSFAYSGEGYWFLQKVIELLTGKPLEIIMQDEVFKPLHMVNSTYIQSAGMDSSIIGPENKDLAWMMPNAAFTLLTNAHDYNVFLQALLTGKGLQPVTQKVMFSKQSNAQWFRHDTTEADGYINWGLGIGLQQNQEGTQIWHWGNTGDFYSFFVANPVTKQSLVYFTQGTSALKITDEIINAFLGKQTTWAMRWLRLGYDHPETMTQLYVALRKHGYANVPALFRKLSSKGYKFSERDINGYGYVLLKQMRYDKALTIFGRQVALYPKSGDAYYSLAQTYESMGSKLQAIDNYKYTLKLDTANTAAGYHIKALQNPLFTAENLTPSMENLHAKIKKISIYNLKLKQTDSY
jgi:CubicO group peptidase (beta-lactamase class C family)